MYARAAEERDLVESAREHGGMQPLLIGGVLSGLFCVTITIYFFHTPDDLKAQSGNSALHKMQGMWGEHDAEFNWCEKDYDATEYIAEWHNTWTSVLYVVASVVSVLLHPRLYRDEPQYLLVQLSVFLTGLGSVLFHATLRYDMQLLDELPLFAISLSAAYTFATRGPVQAPVPADAGLARANGVVKTASRRGAPVVVVAGCLIWTTVTAVLFFTSRHTTLHVVTRGGMSVCFAVMLVYVFSAAAAISREIQAAIKSRNDPADQITASGVQSLFAAAFIFFVAGVVFWIVDNFFCAALRGLPLYPQLHAFGWHLGSAVATWCLSELGALQLIFSRAVLEDSQGPASGGNAKRVHGIRLRWAAGLVPYVIEEDGAARGKKDR